MSCIDFIPSPSSPTPSCIATPSLKLERKATIIQLTSFKNFRVCEPSQIPTDSICFQWVIAEPLGSICKAHFWVHATYPDSGQLGFSALGVVQKSWTLKGYIVLWPGTLPLASQTRNKDRLEPVFSLTQPYRDLRAKFSPLGGQRPGSLPLHSTDPLIKQLSCLWEGDKQPKASEQLLKCPEILS